MVGGVTEAETRSINTININVVAQQHNDCL